MTKFEQQKRTSLVTNSLLQTCAWKSLMVRNPGRSCSARVNTSSTYLSSGRLYGSEYLLRPAWEDGPTERKQFLKTPSKDAVVIIDIHYLESQIKYGRDRDIRLKSWCTSPFPTSMTISAATPN